MTTIARAWCECGFHGQYDTEGRARYALRRHDCTHWRRKRDRMRAGLKRAAARDRTERPCTHKIAHHEHGTYRRYTLDHCHCDPCRAAATAYNAELRRRKAYGQEPYADARPAAAHVRALMAAGMGWKRVAAAAGLDNSLVYPLLYGRPDRNGGAPRTKARRTTVEAILAVPMPTLDDLADGRRVDPTGTARRVQALACIGWSVDRTAARAGIDRQAVDQALRGGQVTVKTARAIRDCYDELWATPAPEGDQRQRIAAARSRNRAARLGWSPPLAWDDEAIDDPAVTPSHVERDGRGFDLDEWLHLVRAGEDPERAARRCGAASLRTVERVAYRAGRGNEYTRARKAVA